MEFVKTLKEYEKDLKSAKKRYDKILKQMKKCTSQYQYDTLYDEAELIVEDINELTLIVQELRIEKKRQQEESLLEV